MLCLIDVNTSFVIFEGTLEEVAGFIKQWGLTIVGAGENDNSIFVA
jgi:hypothetical protein